MSDPDPTPTDSQEVLERAHIIQEAIVYSRRFKGSWFVIHASSADIDPETFSSDLQMLRSLGIYVAVVIAEADYLASESTLGVDLRRALNRDELSAVVLHWDETFTGDADRGRRRSRWQDIGEKSAVVMIIRTAAAESLAAARTLAIDCSAAKLMYLDLDWDPALLPVGGPGTGRPTSDALRPHMASLEHGSTILGNAIDAVDAGIDEAHIVPTRGQSHPVLVEIFTDAGIGTWLGP